MTSLILQLWQKVDANTKFQQDTVPLFALAPQEYITKIGQYILTLPQNFEPFTMQDNLNLKIALKKGKLPHLDEKDLSEELTACWLDSIANATVVALSDEILKIPQIRVNSQRQLIIDIGRLIDRYDLPRTSPTLFKLMKISFFLYRIHLQCIRRR